MLSDAATAPRWADDALFAGRRICERLQEQVRELRLVQLIDEIEDKAPKQMPAAVVLLSAMRPAGEPLRGVAKVEMDWIVLLAVAPRSSDPARAAAKAGPLIPAVVRALQGWAPEGSNKALAWQPGPRPDYGADVSYFPLLFTHQVATA